VSFPNMHLFFLNSYGCGNKRMLWYKVRFLVIIYFLCAFF